jgi:hypothetical protein
MKLKTGPSAEPLTKTPCTAALIVALSIAAAGGGLVVEVADFLVKLRLQALDDHLVAVNGDVEGHQAASAPNQKYRGVSTSTGIGVGADIPV